MKVHNQNRLKNTEAWHPQVLGMGTSMYNSVIKQLSVKSTIRTMANIVVLILCLGLIQPALAVDVDAGEDKIGCPGEQIQIGGDPTASSESSGSFKFTWINGDGQVISTEPNPMITVGNQEEIFTVIVEDKDGFRCDDNMKVTPVVIEEIEFNPEALPNDGSSTAQASATVTPSDRRIVWSIEGNNKGASINPNTGVITAGTQSGTIMIRASDAEAEPGTCFKEVPFCVGEDCCREISEVTFGPISARFSSPVQSLEQDDDGYCSYSVPNAGIAIEMNGVFSVSYSLDDVTLAWKEKCVNNSCDFRDVTISWKGKAPTRTFGALQANLTEISLTVSPSGALAGTTKFTINQVNDVPMGGIAVLKKGTTGSFTYEYKSSTSFEGDWDFGGITGINIDLKKGSSIIGKVTGSMSSDGNMIGKFKANTPGTYSTNGFKATLTELDLGMTYNIADNSIDFTGGTGKAKLTDIANVDGEFRLDLTFRATDVSATVSLNDVRAFGCDITGSVTTDFDYAFDLTSVTGSGISAKHPELDQSFTGVGFEVKIGSLERFDIGAIEVKYKNINFSMSNASFNQAQKQLVFSAKVIVPTLEMSVTRFAIADGGKISIGEISVEFDRSPVKVSGTARWFEDKEFAGRYSGEFSGGIGIKGAMVVGSTGSYNYCYFALTVAGKTGVPIGTSGLKLNKLGGEFGYNWNPGESFGSISGSAKQNTNLIGFLLGIGDVAELAAIESTLRVTIGQATTINLNGQVKVTANPPHYLKGELGVAYTLGSSEFTGSLNSTIKVPPSSGSAVNLNSGPVEFGIQNRAWSINAASVNGQILSAIDITGGISLNSPLSNLRDIVGNINGSITFQKKFEYTYPEGFDTTSCENANSTDNFLGFGISGEFNLELGGSISADLNADGFDGAVKANVKGNSDMVVNWPCVSCAGPCLERYTVSASGLVSVENNGSKTRIYGEVTFSTVGEDPEEAEIDFEF